MRTSKFLKFIFLLIFLNGFLNAQGKGTDLNTTPEAASMSTTACVESFGVPLSPPIYLLNFLLIYFTNPEIAVYMPAYRAAIPQEVYKCLIENPEGCPYSDMAQYFDKQAIKSGGGLNNSTPWPSYCRTTPQWETLAPPKYQQPDQINQPLGKEKADQLARLLGIDQDMILTHEEY